MSSGGALERIDASGIAQANASEDRHSEPLFGLFYDRKDVHYQVCKTVRDQALRRAVLHDRVRALGDGVEPSAELLEPRLMVSQSQAPGGMEVCLVDRSGDVEKLVVPDASMLPFTEPDRLKRRIEEVSSSVGSLPDKCVSRVSAPTEGAFTSLCESMERVGGEEQPF